MDNNVIEIELYADEIKKSKNLHTNEVWTYICLLAVPTQKKEQLLKKLHDVRQAHNCFSEIHGHDIEQGIKRDTACNWMKDVVCRDRYSKCLYFKIVGINHSKLNEDLFGDQTFDNIYNRFFRTAMLGLLHSSFDRNKLKRVVNVFHDQANIQQHYYFPWHSIFRIDKDQGDIQFTCKDITFISSDHRKSQREESHLIQLADILLTGASQCLDCKSKRPNRIALGKAIYPLLSRMLEKPNNVNSSYGYYKKYSASFFPKKRLSLAELADPSKLTHSGFYVNRKIFHVEEAHGQINMGL